MNWRFWDREQWRPVDGMFKDWTFDHFTAENDRFCLWICNGFSCFHDYDSLRRLGRAEPFLEGMCWRRRRAIWKELLREIQRRTEASIENMTKPENVDAIG